MGGFLGGGGAYIRRFTVRRFLKISFFDSLKDEQITQLTDFVKAVMEYHQKSYELLEVLSTTLDDK